MKFWSRSIVENLEHKTLMSEYKNSYYTRPCWDGVHFKNRETKKDIIMFKDGTIREVEFEDIWSRDKKDWMVVQITEEAVKIIENYYKEEAWKK